MTTTRIVRPAVVAGLLVVVAAVGYAFFPQTRVRAAECRGHTGPALIGGRYPLTLQVHGPQVTSTVDFDGRLWRAVDSRLVTDDAVSPGATNLVGVAVLVNRGQATFSSAGVVATFLPLTRAGGCASLAVARTGPRQPSG